MKNATRKLKQLGKTNVDTGKVQRIGGILLLLIANYVVFYGVQIYDVADDEKIFSLFIRDFIVALVIVVTLNIIKEKKWKIGTLLITTLLFALGIHMIIGGISAFFARGL